LALKLKNSIKQKTLTKNESANNSSISVNNFIDQFVLKDENFTNKSSKNIPIIKNTSIINMNKAYGSLRPNSKKHSERTEIFVIEDEENLSNKSLAPKYKNSA
jgi:hypothetical protein